MGRTGCRTLVTVACKNINDLTLNRTWQLVHSVHQTFLGRELNSGPCELLHTPFRVVTLPAAAASNRVMSVLESDLR